MRQTEKGNEKFLEEWFGLNGKTAVVVGASQGLGREIALSLAKAGADVVCVARNEEKLGDTAAEIQKLGRSAAVVVADVCSEKDVMAMVQAALNLSGTINILVYTAGILEAGNVLETELETWRRAMDVNLTGAFLASREAGKAMRNQRGGRIVLIGSTFGDRVLPFVTPYAVSKGGLLQLVRNLAHELAPFGIRVNGIAPGYFDTEMPAEVLNNPKLKQRILSRIPVKRIGNPAEIGPLAVFLASSASDYICGEVVRIDGGQANHIS
jgi:NAD(P)-dependent dehydrogenase (short-subunit alcohol dehydrogenase family)